MRTNVRRPPALSLPGVARRKERKPFSERRVSAYRGNQLDGFWNLESASWIRQRVAPGLEESEQRIPNTAMIVDSGVEPRQQSCKCQDLVFRGLVAFQQEHHRVPRAAHFFRSRIELGYELGEIYYLIIGALIAE